MTKEEEAINSLEKLINIRKNKAGQIKYDNCICSTTDLETVLDMIKEKDKEIEKKDNAVKRIINRLDNDINRITETKRDKSTFPNYLDDYTKCRLKAYRTKTKEIKEYIEEQYFKRKATNDG